MIVYLGSFVKHKNLKLLGLSIIQGSDRPICHANISVLLITKILIGIGYRQWRQSALNSAGALQGRSGEFRLIFTPFYTINFRGLCKSGGARAPAAPPSSAPMSILLSKNEAH